MASSERRSGEVEQQRLALEQKIARLLELEGLRPLHTPENAEDLNKELTLQHLVAAREAGDEFMARYYAELLANPDRLSRTPSSRTAFLDPAQAAVEAAIAKDLQYAPNIPAVFIEEWPTGTMNAESIRFGEGFVVLLNAGSNVLFRHVISSLLREPGAELEPAKLEFLATLFVEYAKGLNLLSVPAPVAAGMEVIKLGIYIRALRNFIVAHEYGHILKGHFSEVPAVNPSTAAEVNEQFIRKSWEEEFQADDVAVELTLGRDFPSDEQRRVLADVQSSSPDTTVILAAAELQAASVAPVIIFTIMSFFDLAVRVVKDKSKKILYETHPPPEKRRDRYVQWMFDHDLKGQRVSEVVGGWNMASDFFQIEPILYDKLAEFMRQMLDRGEMTREELDRKRARMIAEG